jgi:hypothetical protein
VFIIIYFIHRRTKVIVVYMRFLIYNVKAKFASMFSCFVS